MKTRILSGLIGVAALILFTAFGKISMAMMCALVSVLAIYEAYRAFGLLKYKVLATVGMLVFPIVYYIDAVQKSTHTLLLASVLACALFSSMILLYPKVKFQDVCMILTFSLAITVLLSRLYFIRTLPYGAYLVWFAYMGAWLTDTGAYFGGTFFGKHKLIPSISPKKTVEGAVTGVLTTTVLFVLYGLLLAAMGVLRDFTDLGSSLNIGSLALLGAICGVVAQLGDLFASCLKREVGIKDFGNLMPGHGGALDRFDSMIFIAPTVYYFLWLTFIL